MLVGTYLFIGPTLYNMHNIRRTGCDDDDGDSAEAPRLMQKAFPYANSVRTSAGAAHTQTTHA